MQPTFVKLPSGHIINMDRVCFIGKPSARKTSPRSKPDEWSLTVKFINDEKPTIFWYDGDGNKTAAETQVRADYNALVQICTNQE